MKTPNDFVQMLRGDATFAMALRVAKTDEERRRIVAFAEDYVRQFAEVLCPLIEKAENDPNFREQLRRRLAGEDDAVITAADGVVE